MALMDESWQNSRFLHDTLGRLEQPVKALDAAIEAQRPRDFYVCGLEDLAKPAQKYTLPIMAAAANAVPRSVRFRTDLPQSMPLPAAKRIFAGGIESYLLQNFERIEHATPLKKHARTGTVRAALHARAWYQVQNNPDKMPIKPNFDEIAKAITSIDLSLGNLCSLGAMVEYWDNCGAAPHFPIIGLGSYLPNEEGEPLYLVTHITAQGFRLEAQHQSTFVPEQRLLFAGYEIASS